MKRLLPNQEAASFCLIWFELLRISRGAEKRGTLHITLDVLNVGNLLNKNWGAYKEFGITNGYDNIQLLKVAGFQNNQPVYQLNAANVDAFKTNAQFVDDVSTSSTWGMLLGLKFTF